MRAVPIALVLVLLLWTPAVAALTLAVQPDGGLRRQGPHMESVGLAAACEGTPPAPTWRVGTEGFHPDPDDPEAVVRPRLTHETVTGVPEFSWTFAWEVGDVGLVTPQALVEGTLLVGTPGGAFAPAAAGASTPRPLVDGEASFAATLSAGPVRLPAGAAVALEVVLRGTDACADGDAGVVLVRGGVRLDVKWDYFVEVASEAMPDRRVLFTVNVTSTWGGYDDEQLLSTLQLDGPSKAESRVVSAYGDFQNPAMRDRGERRILWVWDPGRQGAAPGSYDATVTVTTVRGVPEFPLGTGTVVYEYPVDAPAPAVVLVLAALALALVRRRRSA